MFILKFAGKILLLPVWLILFVIGLAVKMTVQTYAVVRGILGFIFTLLIIATAYCYHDWVQVDVYKRQVGMISISKPSRTAFFCASIFILSMSVIFRLTVLIASF